MNRPYAAACDRNREPIAGRLAGWLPERARVLEIGSGTGQHAVYFAERFPTVDWQTSDVADHHAGIRAWIESSGRSNVRAPLELDLLKDEWPRGPFDVVYTANTMHIVPIEAVRRIFEGAGRVLAAGGVLFIYGPVNRDGAFTSESNREFDADLRGRAAHMGLRDDRELRAFAAASGLELAADYAMPANNRSLVYRRPGSAA